MHRKIILTAAIALLSIPSSAVIAKDRPVASTPAQQFAEISSLVGTWDVKDRASLKIIFEATAGGSVIVEKWMRGNSTHSLTIYHLDGNKVLATHYCPQGNQPRMAAGPSIDGDIRFTFQDATDLDSSEGFQHDLRLSIKPDGSLVRSEVYWGSEGAGDESHLVLTRSAG